jgi:hypothetical protein
MVDHGVVAPQLLCMDAVCAHPSIDLGVVTELNTDQIIGARRDAKV